MTTESAETVEALIARHVAGALPLPARVLVESHLEIARDARALAAGLEAAAGDELERMPPIEPSGRAAALKRIFASDPPSAGRMPAPSPSVFPRTLVGLVGFDMAEVPWRTRLPGFREYDMGEVDGCHVSLFWIRPGRRIPAHTHEGSELSLVLDGAFSDGRGRYGRGDISIADDTVDHRPVAESDRPCITFAVTDAPLRLTGALGQRLGDILGF